jgi:hypothetical protein
MLHKRTTRLHFTVHHRCAKKYSATCLYPSSNCLTFFSSFKFDRAPIHPWNVAGTVSAWPVFVPPAKSALICSTTSCGSSGEARQMCGAVSAS